MSKQGKSLSSELFSILSLANCLFFDQLVGTLVLLFLDSRVNSPDDQFLLAIFFFFFSLLQEKVVKFFKMPPPKKRRMLSTLMPLFPRQDQHACFFLIIYSYFNTPVHTCAHEHADT